MLNADHEETITPIDNVHFQISVPAGVKHITIRYSDPYFLAGNIAAGAGILLITIGMLIPKKKQKISTGNAPGRENKND